jgi:hypothetical protein
MGAGRWCCRARPYVPVTQRTHTSVRLYTRTFARAFRSVRLPGTSFGCRGTSFGCRGTSFGCRALRSGCRALRSGRRALRSGCRAVHCGCTAVRSMSGARHRAGRAKCGNYAAGVESARYVERAGRPSPTAQARQYPRAQLSRVSRESVRGNLRTGSARGGRWPLRPVRVTFVHTPKSVPADAGRTCRTFSDEFRRPNGHPNPRHGALSRRH